MKQVKKREKKNISNLMNQHKQQCGKVVINLSKDDWNKLLVSEKDAKDLCKQGTARC